MAARDAEAMGFVEQRSMALMAEFPQLDDQSIATLVRDELQNARLLDPAFFQWATAETVARIRRTLVLSSIRTERECQDAERKVAEEAARQETAGEAARRILGLAAPRGPSSKKREPKQEPPYSWTPPIDFEVSSSQEVMDPCPRCGKARVGGRHTCKR